MKQKRTNTKTSSLEAMLSHDLKSLRTDLRRVGGMAIDKEVLTMVFHPVGMYRIVGKELGRREIEFNKKYSEKNRSCKPVDGYYALGMIEMLDDKLMQTFERFMARYGFPALSGSIDVMKYAMYGMTLSQLADKVVK